MTTLALHRHRGPPLVVASQAALAWLVACLVNEPAAEWLAY